MDMLLVTLQPSFAGYVAARLSTRSKPCRVGVLTEIATGIRKPALVVHALASARAHGSHRVCRRAGVRFGEPSTSAVCRGRSSSFARVLIARAIPELRSWRLLP